MADRIDIFTRKSCPVPDVFIYTPGTKGTYVQPRSTGANRGVFDQNITPEAIHEENELTQKKEQITRL